MICFILFVLTVFQHILKRDIHIQFLGVKANTNLFLQETDNFSTWNAYNK